MVTVEWRPYYGSTLKDGGMMTEVAVAAFKRGGHNATIKFIPWPRALKDVAEGKADIVMGAYFSEEREKTYIYSDSFYEVNTGLIARRDAGIRKYKHLEDLKPYRIGTSRGWVNTPEFDAAEYLNKDVARNPTINIQKLIRNRVDMMVAAFGIFRYELSQIGGDVDQFVFLEPPLIKNLLYLLGSRSIPDGEKLVADFNRGLELIRADGTYGEILKKHGF